MKGKSFYFRIENLIRIDGCKNVRHAQRELELYLRRLGAYARKGEFSGGVVALWFSEYELRLIERRVATLLHAKPR